MYGSQSTWHAWVPYICLLFSGFSNVYRSACVWPTALKLGCVTNFDMLFLVMGFISLTDEIQFMLISSHHICTYIGWISYTVLYLAHAMYSTCSRQLDLHMGGMNAKLLWEQHTPGPSTANFNVSPRYSMITACICAGCSCTVYKFACPQNLRLLYM